MTSILHCADLHLSREEREYGVSVLSEILAHAQSCSALLFSGDTFDSYQDMIELRADFCSLLQAGLGAKLAEGQIQVIIIPGNHEHLRAPSKGISMSAAGDWGAVCIAEEIPFTRIPHKDGDIVAIPHQPDYSSYTSWNLPEKNGAWRIIMAHAAVNGMHFLGPDEEEDGSVVDPELFKHFQADYAALGHIHRAAEQEYNKVMICFPGSARVWRKYEDGRRACIRVHVDGGKLRHEWITIESAGKFREIAVRVSPDGQCELPSWIMPKQFHKNDWVQLNLHGVVEDMNNIDGFLEILQKSISVRKITTSCKHIFELKGIRSNSFVQRFETAWSTRISTAVKDREAGISGAEHRIEVLQQARILALHEIYKLLQGQS